MARLAVTPVGVSRSGINITSGGAGLTSIGANTGISFSNVGNLVLVIYNGSASTITVLANIQKQIEGLGVTGGGTSFTIATLQYYIMGALSQSDYMATDGSGLTYIDFTTAASTIAVGLFSVPTVA